jgi:ATP-dependent RNA helicase DeaD
VLRLQGRCCLDDIVPKGAKHDLGERVRDERLHGGMPQPQRTRVMEAFKRAAFRLLVATDVAARGIDVNDLELVVNYDLPFDPEDYVHRIGRTGRAGRKGRAVTLVSGAGLGKLQAIERFTNTRIRREPVPTAEAIDRRLAVLERSALTRDSLERFGAIVVTRSTGGLKHTLRRA